MNINFYLNKAEKNIINALLLSETMMCNLGATDDYKRFLLDLKDIIGTINERKKDAEFLTHIFEMVVK